jgi:hypothetical protein
MDGRGRVERILNGHLDVIPATEAKRRPENRPRIAERLRGLPFEKFMEAGCRFELDNVVLPVRVDQWGNGKTTATACSLVSAKPRIQHGRRRYDARSQR